MPVTNYEIEEKELQPFLIAGTRMQGKYSDCGKGFAHIGRKFGRHIRGPAMLLIYDTEYCEEDADFEACMPIKAGESVDGIQVRTLDGCRCISLAHQGPFNEVGPTYERLHTYAKQKGYKVTTPSREVYLKGPGMLLKGNPQKYLTEVQLIVEPSPDE